MSNHKEEIDNSCSCCGGQLPDEKSEAWKVSDGECPGHLATDATGQVVGCGAFDPNLDWEARQPRAGE